MLLLAAACSNQAASADKGSDTELVGKWSTGTVSSDGVHGTSATWELKADGTFSMSGYPPINVSGKWAIVDRKPGKLRVKLTDQVMKAPGMSPSQWSDVDEWGDLSSDKKTFRYNNQQFNRQ